jgi:hypothetical protein
LNVICSTPATACLWRLPNSALFPPFIGYIMPIKIHLKFSMSLEFKSLMHTCGNTYATDPSWRHCSFMKPCSTCISLARCPQIADRSLCLSHIIARSRFQISGAIACVVCKRSRLQRTNTSSIALCCFQGHENHPLCQDYLPSIPRTPRRRHPLRTPTVFQPRYRRLLSSAFQVIAILD